MKRCGSCKFAAPVSEIDGWCHRAPPRAAVLPPTPEGKFHSIHPPIHLVSGWCGEHQWAWPRILRALFTRKPHEGAPR